MRAGMVILGAAVGGGARVASQSDITVNAVLMTS